VFLLDNQTFPVEQKHLASLLIMNAEQAGEPTETLVSALERNGTKAFQPAEDAVSRAEGQKEFGALISR
jgi:hypothetical protein